MTDSSAPLAIRTHADLTAMWHDLLSPTAGEPPSLSLAFFDADTGADVTRRPAKVCIDDVPLVPDFSDGARLRDLVDEVRSHVECDSVAAALVRGGSPRVRDDDRAWGRCLAEQVGLTERWPVHLVTPGSARVLAADDLLGGEPVTGC